MASSRRLLLLGCLAASLGARAADNSLDDLYGFLKGDGPLPSSTWDLSFQPTKPEPEKAPRPNAPALGVAKPPALQLPQLRNGVLTTSRGNSMTVVERADGALVILNSSGAPGALLRSQGGDDFQSRYSYETLSRGPKKRRPKIGTVTIAPGPEGNQVTRYDEDGNELESFSFTPSAPGDK